MYATQPEALGATEFEITTESIGSRVTSTGTVRCWEWARTSEQVQQDPDRIRNINTTVIVGVGSIHAVARTIAEDVTQQRKSVRDIKTSVTIVVSAAESRCTRGLGGCTR